MIEEFIASATAFEQRLAREDLKRSTVQVEIDGLMYTSTKLPASIGLEIWPRLIALFGAALTRAMATGEGIDFLGLASRAMDDGLMPLVRDLLQRMQCNKLRSTGKGGRVVKDFDEHFAGEYGHLLRVCLLAVAHNLRGPTYGVH